jgi:hypothetical protein
VQPGAPAPAAPAPATEAPSAPPASSQPGISVSEAARLLNQQRRQPVGSPTPTQEGQPPQRVAPRQPAQPAAASTPAPSAESAPAKPEPSGDPALDSIAKALGLPEGFAPGAEAPPAAPAAPAAGLDIDGRHVTPDEVRRALAHQADYTRKTQALAEAQRQFNDQQAALATVLPYIQPELAHLQQQIAGVPRPDPRLIETNQAEYLRQHANWQAAQEEQARLGQLQTLQMQAGHRAMAEQVGRSNEELARQFPDWADPQKRAVWQQKIADWAIDKGGFQRAELANLADHRQLTTMMKAMMWDHMMSGARTSAPRQSAPVRGTAPPPAPTERISTAEQAFDNKPSIRNATQLLTARRANER